MNDVETTKELVRKGEDLPLSILVVRLGSEGRTDNSPDAPASVVDKLDQIKRLQSKDPLAAPEAENRNRNIFRYIRYNALKDNLEKLAMSTFKQIPRQVALLSKVSYVLPR